PVCSSGAADLATAPRVRAALCVDARGSSCMASLSTRTRLRGGLLLCLTWFSLLAAAASTRCCGLGGRTRARCEQLHTAGDDHRLACTEILPILTPRGTSRPMTNKEQVHQLLDELDDDSAEEAL